MGHGKVAIVGAGSLGSTVAYSLILRRAVAEILLVDISTDILQGQVLDLSQAALGTRTIVRTGTFKEAGQADVILLTADVVKRHDESPLQYTMRSRQLLNSITRALQPIQPRAIMIIGIDPVDILTRHLQTTLDLPVQRVFGAGCSAMNTARARHWVSQMSQTGNDCKVNLYVMGTRQIPVIAWQAASVDGQSANTIPDLAVHRQLLEQILITDRINEIKEYKGGAWYGHSAFLTRLTESALSKEASIHVLSVYVERFDACVSVPVVLTREGVEQEVPVPLSPEEHQLMEVAVSQSLREYEETSTS
ncbi:lactate dehydrogenase A [Zychaea mexicana]|uniref:lactate dehydrogenase A n=1 Tax=Zychaea mexicana TaxID=64656 RepID=UPI0022FE785A|nr:lactate dehydrogenase A [Zychaea mexicana]KAI9496005.1 lactate dehydrogenase A [Zychaea mexicana]